jgi:hypothetical protein
MDIEGNSLVKTLARTVVGDRLAGASSQGGDNPLSFAGLLMPDVEEIAYKHELWVKHTNSWVAYRYSICVRDRSPSRLTRMSGRRA